MVGKDWKNLRFSEGAFTVYLHAKLIAAEHLSENKEKDFYFP